MGVFLAPMAGVTDLPFRVLAKECGADLVVSEMISAQALLYKNQKTFQMLAIDPQERPVAIQLFGHDPQVMAEAAKIVYDFAQPEMIDLNFGCPTPKIVKNGDGAAVLKNPALAGAIIQAVVQAVPIPVTAKIRLGWDRESINCLAVAKSLEENGVHWITLHGRTRDQFYSGEADWEWIARLNSQSQVPIVGNGDVFDANAARNLLANTRCEHVAIGRAARGNPWIFQQIKALLEQGVVLAKPNPEERLNMALRHLEMKAAYEGEKRAILEMRSHLSWYLKGLNQATEARRLLYLANSLEEIKRILEGLL